MLLKPSGRNLLFSLFLISSARLPAQTQLTCDATSLATAISAVLTGGGTIGSGQAQSWGWQFPQATIDEFTGCTDFVTCLPTITPIVNSFKTKTFGASCS